MSVWLRKSSRIGSRSTSAPNAVIEACSSLLDSNPARKYLTPNREKLIADSYEILEICSKEALQKANEDAAMIFVERSRWCWQYPSAPPPPPRVWIKKPLFVPVN